MVCDIGKESRAPRLLAQVKHESAGLRRGYIINFNEVLISIRKAVAEAERVAKIKLNGVFLGIGGITLESKTTEGSVAVSNVDLGVTETDIKRVSEASERSLGEFPNRRIIHTLPLFYKLDGKKVLGRPEGLQGTKFEVKTLFIHCLNQHLQDLIKVTEAAGLIVDDIVASPIAAAITALSPSQKTAGCVLANIGAQTTSIVVFEDSIPTALQVFPIGSNDITHDIALGLQISLEEAEKMKIERNYPATVQRKLDEITEARMIDILELIEGHLKKLGRNGLLPAGIIIGGGGSNVSSMEKLAKKILNLPVKIFDPLTDGPAKNQLKNNTWMTAYGLCLYGLRSDTSTPLSDKFRQFTHRIRRWINEFWP